MTATEPSTVQPAAALDRPLFLTGFMGCGKTTLGRAVSERCGVEFVDLDEAVEALPTKFSNIYRLKYDQGLSNAEIAEMYDISPKTVEAQTTKALSRLRKDLEWLLFAITALNAGYDDIISQFAMQVPA